MVFPSLISKQHISQLYSHVLFVELFPGIYISVWNYFQHACQCLELFPDIYVSVWNYFISRHTRQCLEIFPDIYVSVWNYFQHTCLCLELFPDIYLSVWYYFQIYVAAVSGNISRQICQCLELFPDICQCLEIFPDIYDSVWKYFQTNMSGNLRESTRNLPHELSGNFGFVREMSGNFIGGFC